MRRRTCRMCRGTRMVTQDGVMKPCLVCRLDPADHAECLHTTRHKLCRAGYHRMFPQRLPRPAGWDRLYQHKEFNLLEVLDRNGLSACLWSLRATVENCAAVARLLAADFAGYMLPASERTHVVDPQLQAALAVAKEYVLGAAHRDTLRRAHGLVQEMLVGGRKAPDEIIRVVLAATANDNNIHRAAWTASEYARRAGDSAARQEVVVRDYLLPDVPKPYRSAA